MTEMAPLLDRFARPLGNLRVSVTDRCNLRCEYCMPEADYVWLPREDVLQFEEITTLVDLFIPLGVNKVRLTGGEPLLRRDLPELVRMLAAKPQLGDLALTTNGVLLADQIDALEAAGLGRITVSLDTLHADRFQRLTRFDELARVREGLAAAARVFGPTATNPAQRLKIDSVVIRGVNDDELIDLVEYGSRSARSPVHQHGCRGATRSPERVVRPGDARRAVAPATAASKRSPNTMRRRPIASRYRTARFGIIASTTEPFCHTCDRSRLTADGMWYLCLYATRGLDLRAPLRAGVPVEELKALIRAGWGARDDRGAEDRLALGEQRAFVPVQDLLRKDPHLEMHTRGG